MNSAAIKFADDFFKFKANSESYEILHNKFSILEIKEVTYSDEFFNDLKFRSYWSDIEKYRSMTHCLKIILDNEIKFINCNIKDVERIVNS